MSQFHCSCWNFHHHCLLFILQISELFLYVFLSPCSCSFSLLISNSCSLSFANNVAVVKVVRSHVSEMAITFGCQFLSKHFRILMLSSSLSNTLPRPIRWLTMCVNLLCTSEIVSPVSSEKAHTLVSRRAFLPFLHHSFPHV